MDILNDELDHDSAYADFDSLDLPHFDDEYDDDFPDFYPQQNEVNDFLTYVCLM